jgi:hypothetical protein
MKNEKSQKTKRSLPGAIGGFVWALILPVASAMLADVERGILPGGEKRVNAEKSRKREETAKRGKSRVKSNKSKRFDIGWPRPGGKMPPFTAGRRPAATAGHRPAATGGRRPAALLAVCAAVAVVRAETVASAILADVEPGILPGGEKRVKAEKSRKRKKPLNAENHV